LKRRVPQTEAWDVVPDLVVEVVSKTNTADHVLGLRRNNLYKLTLKYMPELAMKGHAGCTNA
jgi:hypothetical protein